MLTPLRARKLPSASSASAASETRSRAWQSERKHSRRSAVHLTGRPRPAGGPGDEGVLGREGVPRAEVAAHVAEYGPAALDRHAEGGGEAGPRLHHAAPRARAQGIAAGRGVVLPDDRPRLERRPGHAVDPASEAHDASRLREGRLRRRAVPDLAGEGEVVRGGRARAGGASLGHGGPRVRHRRQGLVVHLDPLARVGGDRRGLGHDEGDRLAAETHTVSTGSGRCGVTATSNPSGRRSSASGGPVHSGSWGIGRIPSAAASAPVSTASTPGNAAARDGVDPTDPGVGVGGTHHEGAGPPRPARRRR